MTVAVKRNFDAENLVCLVLILSPNEQMIMSYFFLCKLGGHLRETIGK